MLTHTTFSSQRLRTESAARSSLDFEFRLLSDTDDAGYALDAPMYIPTGGQYVNFNVFMVTEFVHREYSCGAAA